MTEYSDGEITYVYTHQAKSSKDAADMLAPHVGKTVTAWLDNGYGHVKSHKVTLAAVGGANVAFWFGKTRFVRDAGEFTHKPVHVHNR